MRWEHEQEHEKDQHHKTAWILSGVSTPILIVLEIHDFLLDA